MYTRKEVEIPLVNGKPVDGEYGPRAAWSLRYYALPPEGIEVTLVSANASPITLRAVDQSYGLPAAPQIAIQPRPDNIMPAMLQFTDSTFVAKSYKF